MRNKRQIDCEFLFTRLKIDEVKLICDESHDIASLNYRSSSDMKKHNKSILSILRMHTYHECD